MISEEIRLEGFDARSWTNLVSLFLPRLTSDLEAEPETTDVPEAGGRPRKRRRGTLFVVRTEEGRVLSAMHSVDGRIAGLELPTLDGVAEVCVRYGARRCIVVRPHAIEEMNERVAMRLQRGDDYVTQWLVLARSFREVQEAGLVHLWPRPLANVPVPPMGAVRATFDLVLPNDHAAVAMLWDGKRPWTSLAVRRRAGLVDLVAGPDLVARWTGPLGGDWRRDARVVVDAVSRALAPVHLGLFGDVATVRRLLAHPDPGAWARAAVTRELVVFPAPPYVSVALGADALRAVADRSTRFLGALDPVGLVAPVTSYLRNRVSEVQSLSDTLGFNPLKALAATLDPAPEASSPSAAERDEKVDDPSGRG